MILLVLSSKIPARQLIYNLFSGKATNCFQRIFKAPRGSLIFKVVPMISRLHVPSRSMLALVMRRISIALLMAGFVVKFNRLSRAERSFCRLSVNSSHARALV